MRGVGVITNTAPTSAYRSAGRPEVMFVLERLIDIACRRHGFDRLALRRRNLVPPDAMPYRNPLGLVYDSGDYPTSLRRAAELGDWAGSQARRAEARRRGRCRGIGIATFVELNTGAPRERAELDDRSRRHGRARARHDVGAARARNQLRPGGRANGWASTPDRSGSSPATPTACRPAAARPRRARCARLLGDGKAADEIIDKGRRIAGAPARGRRRRCRIRPAALLRERHRPPIGIFEIAAAALERHVFAETCAAARGVPTR